MPQTQITTPSVSAQSLPASIHPCSMAVCVAANSHSPLDHIEWRDIFCSACGESECLKGTAQELAEHVVALDWIVTDIQQFDVRCAACQEVFG